MIPAQLHILQHSLGVDKYGMGDIYRNHYCAGGTDADTCKELIALGYMEQFPTTEHWPYFNCKVTDAGRKAMFKESPKPPKMTRSQQRFRDYMDFADAFDCSFKDFLKIQKTDWYKDLKAGKDMSPAWMRGL